MSNSDFLKKVSAFIAKHQMLQKEGTYLVALSGEPTAWRCCAPCRRWAIA